MKIIFIGIFVIVAVLFGSLSYAVLTEYKDYGFSLAIGVIAGISFCLPSRDGRISIIVALICGISGLVLAPLTYLYISKFNVTPADSYFADRGYYLSIILIVGGVIRILFSPFIKEDDY